jgi:uncharacterized protein YwqG
MDDVAKGWPADVPALHASLASAGIAGHVAFRIVDTARPAMMLSTRPADEDAIPLGATKIGGRPDLPRGLPWPERPAYGNAGELIKEARSTAERFHADAGVVPPWMSAEDGAAMLEENKRHKAETREFLRSLSVGQDDVDAAFSYHFTPEQAAEVAHEAVAKSEALAASFPLAFLAQIDLSTLAHAPGFDAALPRDGRLYLFYDLFILPPSYSPHSGVGLRVLYDSSPAEALARTELPEPLARIADIPGTVLRPAEVTTRSVVTSVPQYSHAADALALPEDDADAYGSWLSEVPGWPGDGDGGAHQLGGWRRAIQATMEGTAQLAANGVDAGTADAYKSTEGQALLKHAGAWRLVFQLGPDEAIGNMLPGALNILVREEDLAARRFDRAWAVYEQD